MHLKRVFPPVPAVSLIHCHSECVGSQACEDSDVGRVGRSGVLHCAIGSKVNSGCHRPQDGGTAEVQVSPVNDGSVRLLSNNRGAKCRCVVYQVDGDNLSLQPHSTEQDGRGARQGCTAEARRRNESPWWHNAVAAITHQGQRQWRQMLGELC